MLLTTDGIRTGAYATLLQTADGGATWKPVSDHMLVLPGGISSSPQGASATGADGDVMIVGNWASGCMLYHMSPPIDSIFFRKFVFDGQGYVPSAFYIVGGESRGCAQGRRIAVTPGGRIWVVLRTRERNINPYAEGNGQTKYANNEPFTIRAVYSDDGGVHWRGAGVNGEPTATLADTYVGGPTYEAGGSRDLYMDMIGLVPYGDQVAAFWNHGFSRVLKWSYFDGKTWSEPETVPTEMFAPTKRFSKFIAAVSNGNEILISSDDGLICWDGKQWKDDATIKGAVLTVCGDKFAGASVSASGRELLFWQRSADGKWQSREVAKEDQQIGREWVKRVWAYPAVPLASPPNFVPVAWTCPNERWVKVLRVPVE
jgi:hypothetical protein